MSPGARVIGGRGGRLGVALGAALVVASAVLLVWFLERAEAPGVPSARLEAGAGGSWVVYSEMAEESSKVLAGQISEEGNALAGQPFLLATFKHQRGFGIKASLDPAGRFLAATVLPHGAEDTASAAELWLVELSGGEQRLLLGGVDLQARPVWSQDGAYIAARRTSLPQEEPAVTEVLVVRASGLGAETLYRDETAYHLALVGWLANPTSLLVARLDHTGTDLLRLDPAAKSATRLAHLADSLVRDVRLSPDGSRVLFSAEEPESPGRYRVEVVELTTQKKTEVIAGSNDHFNPVWSEAGRTVTINADGIPSEGARGLRVATLEGKATPRALSSAPQRVEVPLAWSPDGRLLALRSLPQQATGGQGERLAILFPEENARLDLPAQGATEFIGWLESLPTEGAGQP